MLIRKFPSCCTAKILCALTPNHDGTEGRHGSDRPEHDVTPYDLIKQIMYHKKVGQAFVTCVTDTTQPKANDALRWVGFQSSMLMSSKDYKRKVRLWWYPVQSFETQHPRYAKIVQQIEEEQAKEQARWI